MKSRMSHSIAILHRRAQIYYGRELECLGLGPSTLPPLLTLYHGDGLSQEDLALQVGVDKAAMKRSVDLLVEAGYAIREKDEHDGRAWKVLLTPRAHEARSRIEAVIGAWEGLICQGIDPRLVKGLKPVLAAMAANAKAHVPF